MRAGSIDLRDISIVPVDRIEVAYLPRRWDFAELRRQDIDAHFAALCRTNPSLWNGRVLLLGDFTIVDRIFRGSCFEIDYASFLAWQDWGFPDSEVRDCFAMAAVRSSDGAFLLGEMAAHTFNAGQIYFPCGTPDHNDIIGDRVDFERSARRELTEETGLDGKDFAVQPGWHMVLAGPIIAHVKLLKSRCLATELRQRMLDHLAAESTPELSNIYIVRGPDDLDPMMPSFVVAYLQHLWRLSQ